MTRRVVTFRKQDNFLFCFWRNNPQWVMTSWFTRFIVGKCSAGLRDLYMTTHNTHNIRTSMSPVGFEPKISAGETTQSYPLRWVHTCNDTAYRNTVSWQCGRDSWPRNISKVSYAVTLRAFSVCCRYLTVASKWWYGYGLSRCGRATSRGTAIPAPAVTVSSLWYDGQIPTVHHKSP
jgi:hypothetical protein